MRKLWGNLTDMIAKPLATAKEKAGEVAGSVSTKASEVAGDVSTKVTELSGDVRTKVAGAVETAGNVATSVGNLTEGVTGSVGEFSDKQLVNAAQFALDNFDLVDIDGDNEIGAIDLMRAALDWQSIAGKLLLRVLAASIFAIGTPTKKIENEGVGENLAATPDVSSYRITRAQLRAFIASRSAVSDDKASKPE